MQEFLFRQAHNHRFSCEKYRFQNFFPQFKMTNLFLRTKTAVELEDDEAKFAAQVEGVLAHPQDLALQG